MTVFDIPHGADASAVQHYLPQLMERTHHVTLSDRMPNLLLQCLECRRQCLECRRRGSALSLGWYRTP